MKKNAGFTGFSLKALLLIFALTAGGVSPSLAMDPGEALPDPVLEQRARDISRGLRCVMCQNQSIDDSDAPMAQDLRRIVRERLESGASDAEIKEWVVKRYGDFVLLSPPVKTQTLLLWAGPLILLALGLLGALLYWRKRGREISPPAVLTPEERAKLERILSGKDLGQ